MHTGIDQLSEAARTLREPPTRLVKTVQRDAAGRISGVVEHTEPSVDLGGIQQTGLALLNALADEYAQMPGDDQVAWAVAAVDFAEAVKALHPGDSEITEGMTKLGDTALALLKHEAESISDVYAKTKALRGR